MLNWIFLFIILALITFYIAIVAIWLLLGAIINPNTYLVFATSVYLFNDECHHFGDFGIAVQAGERPFREGLRRGLVNSR